jgi:hypothetical protein
MIPEISSYKQIHSEIEILSILEGVGHVDDKGMLQFG